MENGEYTINEFGPIANHFLGANTKRYLAIENDTIIGSILESQNKDSLTVFQPIINDIEAILDIEICLYHAACIRLDKKAKEKKYCFAMKLLTL